VLKSLSGSLGDRATVPPSLLTAIERGWLGKKSGRGFYVYTQKPKKGIKADAGELALNQEMASLVRAGGSPAPGGNGAAHALDEQAIQWRAVLPMVNEAARLLEEGVTDSTDAIDLATVLGTGLAPFRGGLASFADAVGCADAVKRLDELAARHGPRFVPAVLLRDLAQAGKPLSAFASLKPDRVSEGGDGSKGSRLVPEPVFRAEDGPAPPRAKNR
jgi:3-hydroxyacyl-CoA dehydrogenase